MRFEEDGTSISFANSKMFFFACTGGMSKNYTHIKQLMYTEPTVLHGLLQKLADAVVDYIKYQADAGAQTVQIFDSWAAQLSPKDFDIFAGPYIKYIIQRTKEVSTELSFNVGLFLSLLLFCRIGITISF